MAVYGPQRPAAADTGRRGVVWLFLVDDLHIDFRTTGVVRAWLRSLTKELIREEDIFAARTTGPSSVSVGLLAGVEELHQAIDRVSGAALKLEEVLRTPSGAGEIVHRVRVTMKAATGLISSAPQTDPRHRVMVYVGKGFDSSSAADETEGFLAEAWRRDVTIVALDVSALAGAQLRISPLPDTQKRYIEASRYSLDRLALLTRGLVLADESILQDAARISAAIRDSRIRDSRIRD